MRETELVNRIRAMAGEMPRSSRVVRGIGDDCAIVRPGAGEDLVFTSDFVLEGRHFTLASHSAQDVGHKALARSLSDLAAMGSDPVFCLVSLAVTERLGARWVNGFYKGLLALARRFDMVLAGGDLARFEKVVADVVCCGRVPSGKALLRGGARPGHAIYVTGELGGSAHGFASGRGASWRRHLRPEPRIAAGKELLKLGVSAAMDLSDGLSLDLARLCRESKVSAELTGELPIATGATEDEALNGGEDYELLFTAAPSAKIPAAVAGVPVTRVGTITSKGEGKIRRNGTLIKQRGFDHFEK